MTEQPPIIGIGLPKTGTNTLAAATATLLGSPFGINHRPEEPVLGHYRRTGEFDLHGARAVFDINPWPIDAMYRAYPNAVFVWSTRPLTPWLDSCEEHFARHAPDTNRKGRLEIFGCWAWNKAVWTDTYHRHREHVLACHARYGFDMLEMRLGVDHWDTYAGHLGYPVPPEPWPHLNKREDRKTWH